MRFSATVAAALLALALRTTAVDRIVVSAGEYQARRAEVAKAIGNDAMFVALSSRPARRSGDVDWPFRQDDNLLYLTGMTSPDTTLVMLPGEAARRELIFAVDRNAAAERVTGSILSADEISKATGVREIHSAQRVNAFVDAVLGGREFAARGPSAYFAPPAAPAFLSAVRAGRAEVWLLLQDRGSRGAPTREQELADDLRRRYPDVRIRDASSVLLALREIKSETELALIQRAVDITAEAQRAAMRRVLSASRESEVQATIEFTFRNLGACCWAFPSIVASGRNATALHYQKNDDAIARGGLLLTDVGAEVEGYSADLTRTYPVNGVFSTDQRAVYDVVFAAQSESLPLMRPGHRFIEVHDRAEEAVGRELLKLGLVTKNAREQAELYMFHGGGHPLGLQTHDVFDRLRSFEPNMVFTNEPGVYVRKADVAASDVFKSLSASEQQSIRAALDRYDGIGVRIEDDVQITAGDPKVMSIAAPRSAADIERWMAAKK